MAFILGELAACFILLSFLVLCKVFYLSEKNNEHSITLIPADSNIDF